MFKPDLKKLQEWKAKHGEVFLITVDDKACAVRKPNRRDLSFAMAASNGGRDAVKMQESLLNNCWLDGDEEIRTDDALFFGASAKIAGMMEAKEAELKKL